MHAVLRGVRAYSQYAVPYYSNSGKQSHSKRLQEKFLCRTNERKDLGKTNEDTDGVGATTLVKS